MRILETAGLVMNLRAGGQGGSEIDGLLRNLKYLAFNLFKTGFLRSPKKLTF